MDAHLLLPHLLTVSHYLSFEVIKARESCSISIETTATACQVLPASTLSAERLFSPSSVPAVGPLPPALRRLPPYYESTVT